MKSMAIFKKRNLFENFWWEICWEIPESVILVRIWTQWLFKNKYLEFWFFLLSLSIINQASCIVCTLQGRPESRIFLRKFYKSSLWSPERAQGSKYRFLRNICHFQAPHKHGSLCSSICVHSYLLLHAMSEQDRFNPALLCPACLVVSRMLPSS